MRNHASCWVISRGLTGGKADRQVKGWLSMTTIRTLAILLFDIAVTVINVVTVASKKGTHASMARRLVTE
jgi:uncharacterized membrane-anchored protein